MGATDWAPHDGIALLHCLASGLTALERVTGLNRFTMPYPDEAQRALDRTVLACLLADADPPHSMAELIYWCATRPLSDWPLDLPPGTVDVDDRLLDGISQRPTELCHEWARGGGDAAAEYEDRTLIRRALRSCREYGEEGAYSKFRELLVEQPVLTSAELFEVTNDLALEPVHEVIALAYEPAPIGHLRDGVYVTCARCRTLLTPTQDGFWWCERDRCRRLGPPPVGRRLDLEEAGEVHQLKRPLRQFVTWPGLAETALARTLRELGLQVAMWPAFDSYDLRVVFPGGWVWALDVKDWASPRLLGQAARPIRRVPPYDESFWVVPRERVADHPDYIEVYERHRPPEAAGLRPVTDEQLIKEAQRRLTSLPADNRGKGSHA